MRNRKYSALVFLLLLSGCTSFENAGLTERGNFVHFYSSGTNFFGSSAEVDTDGGYILTGEIRHANGVTDALIIKTDSRGQKSWERVIPNSSINGVRPTDSGYIMIGDGIELNPKSSDVNELINSHAKLMVMDKQLNVIAEHIKADSVASNVNNEVVYRSIDYHGNALTLDAAGNIVILGTFRKPGQNELTFVSAFDPSNLSDSLWYRSYVVLGRDYVNCNALHVTPSSDLLWASKTFTQAQNVSREYLSILSVKPNSTIKTNGLYGEDDVQNHSVADIQKSGTGIGYGVVGTYIGTNGSNANIYFIRVDQYGGIVPGSSRYIDGEELLLNNTFLENNSRATSLSTDEGAAITGTADGYVLAGTMTSTPEVGNGGKDILLIKVDAFGKHLWTKLIGGTGDETVTSIRETPDKGLLIFGTNTINGLSSIMLMKTDANGEIKN